MEPMERPTDGQAHTAPRIYQDGLQFFTPEDLRHLPEPSWLVEGLIPHDGVGLLYGPSGSGKSFAALSLGLSISEGMPWLGLPVKQGAVVVLCMEGFGFYTYRIEAAKEHFGVPATRQLFVVRQRINLNDRDAVIAYTDGVNQWRNPAADTHPVALTIVDTLTSATTGAEENSNAERAIQMEHLKLIAEECGGAVLAIAHTGKDVERGVRGATAIKDLSDFVLKLSDSGDGKMLKVEKVKDGEDGTSWPVSLKPVGRSCVFVEADPDDLFRNSGSADADRHVLRALKEAADASGTASYTAWRIACGKPETSFYRSLKRLVHLDYVELTGKRYNLTEAGRRFLNPDTGKVVTGAE